MRSPGPGREVTSSSPPSLTSLTDTRPSSHPQVSTLTHYVTMYNLLSDRLGLHYLDPHIPVVGTRTALLCHNLLPSQKRRKVKHHFNCYCFKTFHSSRTIHADNVASNSFLAITTLNYIMNTCWVFIADRSFKDNKLIAVASLFLFAIAATNILAAGIMARNIARLQKSINKSFAYGIIYRLASQFSNGFETIFIAGSSSMVLPFTRHGL